MAVVLPFIIAAGAVATGGMVGVAFATAASMMLARREQKKAARRALDAYNSSLQDRLYTIRSGVSTHRYVLGTTRVAGTLMYDEVIEIPPSAYEVLPGVYQDGRAYSALERVYALASNECELVSWFIDDEQVPAEQFPGTKFSTETLKHASESFGTPGGVVQGVRQSSGPGFPPGGGSREFVLTQAPEWSSLRAIALRADGGGEEMPVISIVGATVTATLPPNTVKVTITYKYRTGQHLFGRFYPGTATQTSQGWGPPYNSPRWTAAHRLQGIAHLRTLCIWEESLFAQGAPEFSAVVRGLGVPGFPVFDPRTNAYLSAPTSNPALLAGWWMTFPRARGGCGYPHDWIDWDAVADAANVCDETILVPPLMGTGTTWELSAVPRYRCNTVLDTAVDPIANLDIILGSMDGRRAFTGGKYRIMAGHFRPAVATITDDDVMGDKPITVGNESDDEAPPNIATGRFADLTKNWQETSAPAVRNTAYLAADGAEQPLDVPLPATTDRRHAQYLLGVALESERPAMSCTLTVGGIGEDIRLLDTVRLDLSDRPNYGGATFEVVGRVDHWDGTFDLTLTEIRPQTWALDPHSFTPAAPVEPVDTSYLWNVAEPEDFEVEIVSDPTLSGDGSGTARVVLSWAEHAQPYVREGGVFELRYRHLVPGEMSWRSLAPVPGSALGTAFTAPMVAGGIYEFQARAGNGVGARSSWETALARAPGAVPVIDGSVIEDGTLPNAALVVLAQHAMSITPDPGFEDLSLWTLSGHGENFTPPERQGAPQGVQMFGRYYLAGMGSDSACVSRMVPISPRKRYRAFAWTNRTADSNRPMYLMMAFYDEQRRLITGAADPAGWPAPGGTFHYWGLAAQVPPAGWKEHSIAFGWGGPVHVPHSASYCAIGSLIHLGGSQGYNYVAGLRVQQLQETELLAPGAVTDVLISTAGRTQFEAFHGQGEVAAVAYQNPYDVDVTLSVNATINAWGQFGYPTDPAYIHAVLTAQSGNPKYPLASQGQTAVTVTSSGLQYGSVSMNDRCVLAPGQSTRIVAALNRSKYYSSLASIYGCDHALLRVEVYKA